MQSKGFWNCSISLCLGNISKDWSVDNIKKTELKGYVCDFSVDYDPVAVVDILDIHNKINYICKANICFGNGAFWL